MLELYLKYIQEVEGNSPKKQLDQIKKATSKELGGEGKGNLNNDVISRMGPSMKYHYKDKNDIDTRKSIYKKRTKGNKKTDKSGIYKFESYLERIQERLEEDSRVKRIRETKKYIWLYHGTSRKAFEFIRRNGIDPAYIGSGVGAPKEHPTGKDAISYTTNKHYASAYTGGIFKPGPVLLVKVPTKDLFFGIRDRWSFGYLDEYQSPYKIPIKDIVSPEMDLYKKLEKDLDYLQWS